MTQNINIFKITKQAYGSEYDAHLFEQYKLYVEMADRVSARRSLANTFFLGVNTALLTALAVLLKENILSKSLISCTPFIAASLLCFVWWRTTISYRQLNTGKFKIIHLIEQQLPVGLYDAEWEALGKGENSKLYRPLTHVENWVPICFIVLYLAICTSIWTPEFVKLKNEAQTANNAESQAKLKINLEKASEKISK